MQQEQQDWVTGSPAITAVQLQQAITATIDHIIACITTIIVMHLGRTRTHSG